MQSMQLVLIAIELINANTIVIIAKIFAKGITVVLRKKLVTQLLTMRNLLNIRRLKISSCRIAST